jgi:hypothetical protein
MNVAGAMTDNNETPDRPACSPAAARMRRSRRRRSRGFRSLIIELHETEIAAFVGKGLLARENQSDLRAVRKALYVHLEQTLSKRRDAQQ